MWHGGDSRVQCGASAGVLGCVEKKLPGCFRVFPLWLRAPSCQCRLDQFIPAFFAAHNFVLWSQWEGKWWDQAASVPHDVAPCALGEYAPLVASLALIVSFPFPV